MRVISETQGVYLCRMKGYENDWVQLQPGQHSVRYSTLPAGDYEFEVKYAPSIASSQEQVASIEVSVTPYFWKSWLFVSIILIGIIAAVQYLYMRRLEKMREQEVEALYRPIEAALKESDEPGKLQNRIQAILENQRRYQESQDKTVLADKEAVEKNSIPFMDEVMSIMEKNFHDSEFGVQELADALGMNRSVLSKKLNAETGLPTSQFIRNYRLDIARKMITDNVILRRSLIVWDSTTRNILPVVLPSSMEWLLRVSRKRFLKVQGLGFSLFEGDLVKLRLFIEEFLCLRLFFREKN